MPRIQQIGRVTYYEGKRLFDILCRLKNFGVGRVVLRNHYVHQYPEPTYFVILKVEPDMSDPTQTNMDCRVTSMAYLQKIFRGEDYGEFLTDTSYKPDWKLVPRSEEHKYLNAANKRRIRNFIPDTIPFPPLLNHFIMLERKQKGEPLDPPPVLPIKSVVVPRQPHYELDAA